MAPPLDSLGCHVVKFETPGLTGSGPLQPWDAPCHLPATIR